MKVAVYTCALNEEAHVDSWARSAEDADVRLVLDTGSSDNTIGALRDANVMVGCMAIRPWRFDDARNASMALIPPDIDICIQLDMDEILTPGWRNALEIAWKPGTTRLHYKYVWSWTDDGKPDRIFYADKISGRFTHRWKNPVHEVLTPTCPEMISVCDKTLIEHYADSDKSRGYYLKLLELSVQEDPLNDRNSHYLGRQYFYEGMYEQAINEFQRHLTMPTSRWPAERAASLRHGGACYEGLGNLTAAHNWLNLAVLEDSQSREALVDLASFLLRQGDWQGTVYHAHRALQIPSDQSSYINERYALEEGPFDLAAVALSKMGERDAALAAAEKALSFNPIDPRLQKNLQLIRDGDAPVIDDACVDQVPLDEMILA